MMEKLVNGIIGVSMIFGFSIFSMYPLIGGVLAATSLFASYILEQNVSAGQRTVETGKQESSSKIVLTKERMFDNIAS